MDNNQENKSIQIMLPNMLNYTAFQDEIRNDFSQSKLNVEFNKFKESQINVNLLEKNSNISIELGFSYDNKNTLFIKDRATLVYFLNKRLKAFCLLPSQEIIRNKVLGITPRKRSKERYSEEISFYSKEYAEIFLETPINKNQIIDESSKQRIIETLNKNTFKVINFYGDLDHLIPFIEPYGDCLINIFSNKDKIRHRLETKKINNCYAFNVQPKDPLTNLLFEITYLSLRKVLLDIEYEIPINKINACQSRRSELLHIKSIIETYYEILSFGQKYSQYLFEDSKNNRPEKELIEQQKKIQEVCNMIKKIEPQFFGLEFFNEVLFTGLGTMPPASISELSLLQKEAFVETSLAASAFFDLLSTALNILLKEDACNEK